MNKLIKATSIVGIHPDTSSLGDELFYHTRKDLVENIEPEIIEAVNDLRSKQGTEDLRKVISNLADDLENSIDTISASNPEIAPLVPSIKTLNILMDLYFSL